MVADPSTLQGAHWIATPPNGTPNAVATSPLSFFPSTGSTFGIMTNGDATLANTPHVGGGGADDGGPNASGHGSTDYDTSILRLDLNAPPSANCLVFDFAFYSNEYPNYVGSSFNDAFIAELDKSTWQATNSTIDAPDNFAHDANGKVVSINSTGADGMSLLNAGGTTYGGATTLLQATTPVTPGAHSLYLSIFDQGDHVFDSAAFVDNIRFVTVTSPTASCQPGAQPKSQQTPLIVLPGVGGSTLVDKTGAEVWPRAEDLWTSADDNFLLRLGLQPDGVSPIDPSDPITAGQPISNTDVAVLGGLYHQYGDYYATLLTTLLNAGYVRYPDGGAASTLFPYPYDWRLDDRSKGKNLLNYIDFVLKMTGASQVDILAHSQGGLLTRYALSDPSSIGKVRRVLTLGTPILGAAKALGEVAYQTPCFVDGPICAVNQATLQKALRNIPGAYELMPDANYDQFVGPAVVDDLGDPYGTIDVPHDEWAAQVRENQNAALMDLADQFHQQSDVFRPADPSVTFYRIIGSGVPTVRAIRQYHACDLAFFNCGFRYDTIMGTGDGTVPQHSADVYNPDTHVDLRGDIPNLYVNGVKHTQLPGNPDINKFALAYFGIAAPAPSPTPQPPPEYMPPPSPSPTAAPAGSPSPAPSGVPSPGPVPPPSSGATNLLGALVQLPLMPVKALVGLLHPTTGHSADHGTHVVFRGTSPGVAHSGGQRERGMRDSQLAGAHLVPIGLGRGGGSAGRIGGARPHVMPATAPQDAPGPIDLGGLSTTPSQFGGIELEAIGPVSGTVADAAGNVIGQPQGAGPIGALSEMPGGIYNAIDDTQSYFVYQAGAYTSTLTVGGGGSVQLRVRSYSNSQMTGMAIFNVQAPGAALRLTLSPGQDLGAVRLQIVPPGAGGTGNMVAPDSVVTGAAVTDMVPPTTTATIRPAGDASKVVSTMTVALAGQDDPGGSGVAATYYEVGQQVQSVRYTAPFTVPVGTTIRFLSVDNAGNTESVQTLLVDDAPNTRAIAEPLAVKGQVRRFIAPQGDEDWFTFAADGRSTYKADLVGLTAPYGLELYDATGSKIASDTSVGTSSKSIRMAPAAGQYYLRVFGQNGAWDAEHPYQLKVDTIGH